MPIKIAIKINFKEHIDISKIKFKHLHALIFEIYPPEIASQIHERKGFKPFCLWCPALINPKDKTIKKNLTAIISFLDDSLLPPFLKSLAVKNDFMLNNYKIKLSIPSRSTLIGDYIYSDFKSFLSTNLPDRHALTFNFITPVSFKKGKVDYPLPEAKLVFKSLIKKWNFFSQQRVDVDLSEAIEKKLTISYLNIKTVRLDLGDNVKVTGFKGSITYIGKNLSPDEIKWLNALGQFSNFAGVGRKCTMGLGFTNYTNSPFKQLTNKIDHDRN